MLTACALKAIHEQNASKMIVKTILPSDARRVSCMRAGVSGAYMVFKTCDTIVRMGVWHEPQHSISSMPYLLSKEATPSEHGMII
jgi:hypothetical protein